MANTGSERLERQWKSGGVSEKQSRANGDGNFEGGGK